MNDKDTEILEQMSRPELISWIRENVFTRAPNLRWLYYHRWQVQIEALRIEEQKHSHYMDDVDLKKRDEYAAQFNQTDDTDEKFRLAGLIKPYDDLMKWWLDEGRKIDKKRKKIDLLYEKAEAEER